QVKCANTNSKSSFLRDRTRPIGWPLQAPDGSHCRCPVVPAAATPSVGPQDVPIPDRIRLLHCAARAPCSGINQPRRLRKGQSRQESVPFLPGTHVGLLPACFQPSPPPRSTPASFLPPWRKTESLASERNSRPKKLPRQCPGRQL